MSQKSLTEEFSLTHDTLIQRPLLWTNRADAVDKAEMKAYTTLLSNRSALKEHGLQKPAAALYVDKNTYNFTIYDKDERAAEDAVPHKRKVISVIDPYL